MSDKKQACGNCRFWMKDADDGDKNGHGWCCRYPPVIQRMDGVSYPNSEWPHASESDWCGEWKSAKAEEAFEKMEDVFKEFGKSFGKFSWEKL